MRSPPRAIVSAASPGALLLCRRMAFVVLPFTGKYKRLEDADVQRDIRTLADGGKTFAQIADLYRCSQYAVQRVLYTSPQRQAGRPRKACTSSNEFVLIRTRRNAALNDPKVQIDIRKSKKTNQELADLHKVSSNTISRIRCARKFSSDEAARAVIARDLAIIEESKTATRAQLAKKYGIGQTVIRRIVLGETMASAVASVLDTSSAPHAITTAHE